jgi:hypothetical protein
MILRWRSNLVLIRVYPRESAADFFSCTILPWRDLAFSIL